jgi:hypothetical protein
MEGHSMHKRVLAVLVSVEHVVSRIKGVGGHVPPSGLDAAADSLETAAHRFRLIAQAKRSKAHDLGAASWMPPFFK